MKLKLRIKKNIRKELSWARNHVGEIIELNEEDSISLGRHRELGIEIGALIELKHLDIIEAKNIIHAEDCHCCHCHCCCNKCC